MNENEKKHNTDNNLIIITGTSADCDAEQFITCVEEVVYDWPHLSVAMHATNQDKAPHINLDQLPELCRYVFFRQTVTNCDKLWRKL